MFRKLSSFDVENETLRQYYENKQKSKLIAEILCIKNDETFVSDIVEKGERMKVGEEVCYL